MPNQFHLVLWPYGDGDVSGWMQWLLTAHVRRYHRHYGGSGHVWQGRFKAFPIQEDEHLLAVLRYVDRNACGPTSSAAPRTGALREDRRWRGAEFVHVRLAGEHVAGDGDEVGVVGEENHLRLLGQPGEHVEGGGGAGVVEHD
jgi:hypothetical protein